MGKHKRQQLSPSRLQPTPLGFKKVPYALYGSQLPSNSPYKVRNSNEGYTSMLGFLRPHEYGKDQKFQPASSIKQFDVD